MTLFEIGKKFFQQLRKELQQAPDYGKERAVLRFIEYRREPTPEEFQAAVDHFYSAPEFTPWKHRRVMLSKDGGVRVEDDIYGYEITIYSGPLLDVTPTYYRLTQEQADKLFDAILSCVPGSNAYEKRFAPTVPKSETTT